MIQSCYSPYYSKTNYYSKATSQFSNGNNSLVCLAATHLEPCQGDFLVPDISEQNSLCLRRIQSPNSPMYLTKGSCSLTSLLFTCWT